jgi:hypothetical protein
MQVNRAVPSTRPNHKRSKNFSDHEDEVLVSAWLNISLDPMVGKDKKVEGIGLVSVIISMNTILVHQSVP